MQVGKAKCSWCNLWCHIWKYVSYEIYMMVWFSIFLSTFFCYIRVYMMICISQFVLVCYVSHWMFMWHQIIALLNVLKYSINGIIKNADKYQMDLTQNYSRRPCTSCTPPFALGLICVQNILFRKCKNYPDVHVKKCKRCLCQHHLDDNVKKCNVCRCHEILIKKIF